MYGAGFFRQPPYSQFCSRSASATRAASSLIAKTMKATINSDIGVKVFDDMRAENKFMPPGVETWGFVEESRAFLNGDIAMTISWPPYGRWAAGYGTEEKALSWVPKSKIAGKVGYALPPGGSPELAAGFALACRSNSKNKEAAYLFIQWLNSEDVSTRARSAALYAARPVPRVALHRSRHTWRAGPMRRHISRRSARGRYRTSGSLHTSNRQVRRGLAPGDHPAVGGRDPARRYSTTSQPSGTT